MSRIFPAPTFLGKRNPDFWEVACLVLKIWASFGPLVSVWGHRIRVAANGDVRVRRAPCNRFHLAAHLGSAPPEGSAKPLRRAGWNAVRPAGRSHCQALPDTWRSAGQVTKGPSASASNGPSHSPAPGYLGAFVFALPKGGAAQAVVGPGQVAIRCSRTDTLQPTRYVAQWPEGSAMKHIPALIVRQVEPFGRRASEIKLGAFASGTMIR